MRKASMQAVVVCSVLTLTVGTANATYFSNMFTPSEEVIDSGNPQPWGAAEEVRIGASNFVGGPGNWDGNMRVDNTAAPVTSGRLYVGFSGVSNSGKLIIDGASWTAGGGAGVLHLGQNASNGAGGDELSVLEVKNGATLIVDGTEMGQSGGGILIIDGIGTSFSTGSGHYGGNGPGNTTVTLSGGATALTGFTSMGVSGGSGHTTINVEGAGSLWTGHTFYMGGAARSASLNITGGATVLADNFFLSQGTEFCDVTIRGASSSLSATHEVNIGEVGPGQFTVDEGGMFTHTANPGNLANNTIEVSNSGTLIFGLGNGSKIATTGNAVLDDGATIGATADGGFTPVEGVPYDLITSDLGVSANPTNLVLDLSALDGNSAAAGFLSLNGGGTVLQLTLTDTGQGGTTLTQVDNVNVTFFDFNSVLGFEYDLESSTNMADWVFTGLIVTGDGGTMSVFDPMGTDTNKSYRLSISGTGP